MPTDDFQAREARVMELAAEREKERRARENRLLQERKAHQKAQPFVDPRRELVFGLGRGLAGAVEEAGDGLNAINAWINENVVDSPHIVFGQEADNGIIGIERFSELERPDANIFGAAEAIGKAVKDTIPETETIGGELIETGSRFVAGFLGAGKFRWIQSLKNGGKVATATGFAAQGAIADFAVFDGHEERLSDFLTQFDSPLLNNAVTQYLAVEGSDAENVSELEGRVKNVLEGAGLGVLADGLIRGLRALKPVRRVRDAHSKLQERKAARKIDGEADDIALDDVAEDSSPATRRAADDTTEEVAEEVVADPRTRLHASVDMQDIRSTVQRLVDEGATEDIIELLAKGDSESIQKIAADHYVDWDSFSDDPTSLLQFVRSFEGAFDEAISAAKGGRVPTRETVERGLKLLQDQTGGELADNLFDDVTAAGGLSSRVYAGQQLLAESRSHMYDLARTAAGGDKRAQAKLLQHANAHAVLEAQVTGAASEVGRSLRAMQIIKKQLTSETFDLDEMLREAGQTGDLDKFAKKLLKNKDNPASVHDIVSNKLRTTKWDMALEVLYGNILAAPSTQIANIIGNVSMTALDTLVRAAAIVPGTARRVFGKTTSTGVAEFRGAMVGMMRGLQDSFRFSLKALLDDFQTNGFRLHKMSEAERTAFWNEQEQLGTVWKALITGEAQTDVVTKLGEAGSARRAIRYTLPDDIANKPLFSQAGHYTAKLITNTTGGIIRLPGRAILTVDEFFKTLSARTEEYAVVAENAYTLSKLDRSRSFSSYADELLDPQRAGDLKQLREAKQQGVEFARRQTFQQKLEGGMVMNAIGKFEGAIQALPPARLFVPFIRTPTNIALKAIELTPGAQFLSRRFRNELAAGGKRADKAIAQFGFTATFGWWLFEQHAAGNLKGTGSKNNSAYLEGVKRYSIKMGDEWYTFDRLDPLGMLAGFMADIFDTSYDVRNSSQEEELSSMFAGVLSAISANLTSKAYLRGISELISATENAERGSVGGFQRLAGSTLANLMPLVGSNFERRRAAGQDEFARYIFNWMDEFRSRIPEGGPADALGLDELIGTRSDLGVRRDPLGRAVENQLDLTRVIQTSRESGSALDQSLAELDFRISVPSRSIAGVKLTGKQYSKLLFLRGQEVKIAGITLEDRLSREVESPLFHRRTLEGRQDRVNDIVRDYTERARRQLQIEDTELAELIESARQEKRDSLRLIVTEKPSEATQDSAQEFVELLTGE